MTSPPPTVIPYSYSSVIHDLISNPLFSTAIEPLHCKQSDESIECESYILSGGLSFTALWTQPGYPNHPLVRIRNVPTVQFEFRSQTDSGIATSFTSDDCVVLGSTTALISAELCLSPVNKGSRLYAALFICNAPLPNPCNRATSSTSVPNITTTLSLSSRTATLITSRSNLTTLSLSDLTPPTPLPFDPPSLQAYRSALTYLLNYSAAAIPPPSSTLELFWSARHTLAEANPFMDGILLRNFRSLLAFPVWLFKANNYGNTALQARVLNPGLPGEFYTRAEVVRPLVKLKVEIGFSVGGFMVLEGVALVVLWMALWGLFWPGSGLRSRDGRKGGQGVKTTGFPVADILFRATVKGDGDREWRVLESGEVIRRARGFWVGVETRERENDIQTTETLKEK